MAQVGGIDVGGTTVKAGVLDGDTFTPVGAARPTPHDAAAVIDLVCGLVADLADQADLSAVGVAVPGIVDERTGVGVWSANLGWRDVPFRDRLTDRLDLPVAFGHDVRCGGLAEARLGAAHGHRDVAFIPVGTGIAAALVLDGRPYAAGGWAGELGHVDIGHLERCACGRTGCLEALSSGSAIVARFAARSGQHVAGAADVAARVLRGSSEATAVWDEALEGLALALSWLASVLAPEVVVLGGGVAMADDSVFLDPLRRRVAERLAFQRCPALVRAALGARAGSIGAALRARDLLEGTS